MFLFLGVTFVAIFSILNGVGESVSLNTENFKISSYELGDGLSSEDELLQEIETVNSDFRPQADKADCYCGENGVCIFDDGRRICRCDPHYIEEDGMCVADDTREEETTSSTKGDFECSCGENSVSCHLDQHGKSICECKLGFAQFNSECQECHCGNATDCIFDFNGEEICKCLPGYSQKGKMCERCDCGSMSNNCKFDGFGNKVCQCDLGYFQIRGKCAECDCGENSIDCEYDRSKGEKQCHCKNDFTENDGTCVEICIHDLDCQNGRICRRDAFANFCDCPPNFSGENCEISEECERLKPFCEEMRGECRVHDGVAECKCPAGKAVAFPSRKCEDACGPETCIFGECQEVNGSSFYCRCHSGFTGLRCDRSFPEEHVAISGVLIIIVVAISVLVLIILSVLLCISIRNRK